MDAGTKKVVAILLKNLWNFSFSFSRAFCLLLGNATVARLIEDPELKKVKSAAKALNYAEIGRAHV